MHGLINKLVAVPGQRDTLARLVLTGSDEMPGCLSYVVAADAVDPDTLWVTEIWAGLAEQEASLSIPAVEEAIALAMPLIASFESIARTEVIGVVGT